MLKILMFGKENDRDYFDCIKQSLLNNNIKISFLERFPLLEFQKIFKYRLKGGKIIHYNFIDFYYEVPNYMASLIRAIIFLITNIFFKFIGLKIIWTAHNDLPHEMKNKTLVKITRKIFYRLSDDIFAVTNAMKNRLIELFGYKKNIHLVLLGNKEKERIKWENIKVIEKQKAREKLNINKDTKVFISLGRIWRYRKNDVLVKAFNLFSEKYQDSLLIILGKPKNENIKNELITLKDKNKKIILKLYYVPLQEVVDYVSASDFVCITNDMYGLTETFGLAMLLGKPSIASRIGSNEEIINKHKMGLLYKKNDILDLAATLEKATKLKNTELKEISNRIKKEVKKYDWDNAIKGYIKIYKRYY